MATDITNPGADNKPNGFLAYANRHYPTARAPILEHSPPPPTFPPPPVSSYKQCMRNHAASIGGHALDGCCEFMPSPMFNSSDPTSLRCAACGCHRNFHRHTTDSSPASDSPPAAFSTPPQTLANVRKRPAAASSGAGGAGKKRFRTRFSRDQKERMYGFAERLGWKMQRVDKRAVEEFCSEIGVGKEVLKVWMHNNKNTIGRNKEIDNNGGGSGDRLHLLSANASSSSSQ